MVNMMAIAYQLLNSNKKGDIRMNKGDKIKVLEKDLTLEELLVLQKKHY